MSQSKYRKHSTIGFVGLGMMGGRMIRNLKGFADLLVYDVDPVRAKQAADEAGATAVTSLADPAKADTVVLMLPSSPIVDEVVRGGAQSPGLLKILTAGSMIIDMSSSTPANTIENAKLAQQIGVTYIDAPVSGGPTGAASGKLAIMVGGSVADFEHARPVLERMGTNVIRAGDVGSGHAVKSLNNLLAATILAATSEVFAVGEKFGLDPEVMHQIINASSGSSFMTQHTWPKAILPKTWDFGFAMQLMNKDVGIAMALIESTGVETVLAKANAEMWAQGLKAARHGADMTELTQQIRRGAGL